MYVVVSVVDPTPLMTSLIFDLSPRHVFSGKEAEQASGLTTSDIVIEAPITEARLVVMERISVLLTRSVYFKQSGYVSYGTRNPTF